MTGRGEEAVWAPAVLASDYDGCLHLVALVDEVDAWEVTVTRADGATQVVEAAPATGFYYYPALADRPSWFVDGDGSWELRIDGQVVDQLRGTRTGDVPDDAQP